MKYRCETTCYVNRRVFKEGEIAEFDADPGKHWVGVGKPAAVSDDHESKDQLKAQLDALGVEYDARLGVDKLAALLAKEEAKAEAEEE